MWHDEKKNYKFKTRADIFNESAFGIIDLPPKRIGFINNFKNMKIICQKTKKKEKNV